MAANSYTMSRVYIVVNQGQVLPPSLLNLKRPGEGTNDGDTNDGRVWFKDCFIGKDGIDQLRDLIHAEDAGVLELKTPTQMRALLPARIQV